MKKQLFLLVIALFFFTSSPAQEYGWNVIDPESIPDSPGFSGLYFTDKDTGWISVSSPYSLRKMYRTNDGGATFSVHSTPFPTTAVQMLNADIGFAVGFNSDVIKTTNGGLDWTSVGTSSSTGLYDISFPLNTDPNNPVGYTCGNMSLYRVDTGVTNLGPPYTGTYNRVSAPSDDNLWICTVGKVLHYTNNTFTEPAVPSGNYSDIYFINNEEGWIVGDNELILHTGDAGANWEVQQITKPISDDISGTTLNCVFFLNSDEGWAAGERGVIIHTINGGAEWNVETRVTNNNIMGVHFTSSYNGYAVGYDKTILKYTEISGLGDEVGGMRFEIFPNPAVDEFKVQSLKFKVGGATIELYDLNGRKLLEKQIAKGTEEINIDVRTLNSGVYMCRISTENGSVTKKMIIQ